MAQTQQAARASDNRIRLVNLVKRDLARIRNDLENAGNLPDTPDEVRRAVFAEYSTRVSAKVGQQVNMEEFFQHITTGNGPDNKPMHGRAISSFINEKDPVLAAVNRFLNPAGGPTID